MATIKKTYSDKCFYCSIQFKSDEEVFLVKRVTTSKTRSTDVYRVPDGEVRVKFVNRKNSDVLIHPVCLIESFSL